MKKLLNEAQIHAVIVLIYALEVLLFSVSSFGMLFALFGFIWVFFVDLNWGEIALSVIFGFAILTMSMKILKIAVSISKQRNKLAKDNNKEFYMSEE